MRSSPTTDRLSGFSRGRVVLHGHAHDWRPGLRTALAELPAGDYQGSAN